MSIKYTPLVLLRGFLTVIVSLFGFFPVLAFASENPASATTLLDLTQHYIGYISVGIFVIAYLLVMVEEFTALRKSKPVIIAAGLIWLMAAIVYKQHAIPANVVEHALKDNLLEYAELMLFLLVAMTYINVMQERLVFDALRGWLIRKNFSYRSLFWLTGFLAFFISPVADNLTTALIMCAVLMAVGSHSPKFITLGCINIVIGANAGGAFSPFGDITTLMVWTAGVVDFTEFFDLFLPSLVNFVVPAAFMHFAVPKGIPESHTHEQEVIMKRGALRVVLLFLLTIITTVAMHNFLELPAVLGMMTGLGYLQFFVFYLKKTQHLRLTGLLGSSRLNQPEDREYDIFTKIAQAEWDTLLFFYGVVLCVGGLGFMGYLSLASHAMYGGLGATTANFLVGILSAVIDNIPVMYAVLNMHPEMAHGQWLLVTLTAGVGGSLLSVGSAAGVALMGQTRGLYTFFGHLKWTPVIFLGYCASVYTHWIINHSLF